MAASAASAAISSLSLSRRHHYLPSQPSIFSFSFTLSPPKSLSLFRPRPASSTIPFSFKIRASDDDDDDFDASFSDEVDPDSEIPYDPSIPPEDYDSTLYSDDLPTESEEDVAAAYEELYGPAFSGISVLGNDVFVEDSRRNKATELGLVVTEWKKDDMFEERLVQVRRVTKVVKGGKQLQFRAVLIIGDKQGRVGVGVGKGKEVTIAVEKSARDARRNIITVPMTKYLTFPHRLEFTSQNMLLLSAMNASLH
ncbi:ribosomal protein S5 [Asimina triloba]